MRARILACESTDGCGALLNDEEPDACASVHGMPSLPNQSDDVNNVPLPPTAKGGEQSTSLVSWTTPQPDAIELAEHLPV